MQPSITSFDHHINFQQYRHSHTTILQLYKTNELVFQNPKKKKKKKILRIKLGKTFSLTLAGLSSFLVLCFLFSTIYGDTTLSNGVGVHFADKRVDLDPNKREHRSQEHRPKHNNGRSSVLSSHETLEERIEVENHPEGKEDLPEKWTPGFVALVEGVGEAGHDADEVDDEERGGRDEQRRPLDDVELPELRVVRGFRSDGEVGVEASQHLQEALEDGEEVRGDAADHPELLVTPQLLDGHTAPPQLEHARRDDGDEEAQEEEARQV